MPGASAEGCGSPTSTSFRLRFRSSLFNAVVACNPAILTLPVAICHECCLQKKRVASMRSWSRVCTWFSAVRVERCASSRDSFCLQFKLHQVKLIRIEFYCFYGILFQEFYDHVNTMLHMHLVKSIKRERERVSVPVLTALRYAGMVCQTP